MARTEVFVGRGIRWTHVLWCALLCRAGQQHARQRGPCCGKTVPLSPTAAHGALHWRPHPVDQATPFSTTPPLSRQPTATHPPAPAPARCVSIPSGGTQRLGQPHDELDPVPDRACPRPSLSCDGQTWAKNERPLGLAHRCRRLPTIGALVQDFFPRIWNEEQHAPLQPMPFHSPRKLQLLVVQQLEQSARDGRFRRAGARTGLGSADRKCGKVTPDFRLQEDEGGDKAPWLGATAMVPLA